MKGFTRIDVDMLCAAIASNTDADEQTARQIVSTVLYKQRRHGDECDGDPYAKDVCEGMYADKCDDVIGLVEALRAVLAIAGESAEVRSIVESAIRDHGGGPDVG